MLERDFQAKLVKELNNRFPGCLVYKNDTRQGLPDLTVLYKNHWALLECKRDEKAVHQKNQDYYISTANDMSFARFIFPENREEVLNELQQAFES